MARIEKRICRIGDFRLLCGSMLMLRKEATDYMSELAILDFIQAAMRSTLLDHSMVVFSTIGNLGALWIVLGIVLMAMPRFRMAGVAVLVALAFSGICCELLIKPLVMRPRPCDVSTAIDLLIACPKTSSFPSGHTTASFAAASALAFGKAPRKLVIPVAVAAFVMGFTRLYLYVHYPSDVLAGAVLGVLLGFAAASLIRYAANRSSRGSRGKSGADMASLRKSVDEE